MEWNLQIVSFCLRIITSKLQMTSCSRNLYAIFTVGCKTPPGILSQKVPTHSGYPPPPLSVHFRLQLHGQERGAHPSFLQCGSAVLATGWVIMWSYIVPLLRYFHNVPITSVTIFCWHQLDSFSFVSCGNIWKPRWWQTKQRTPTTRMHATVE